MNSNLTLRIFSTVFWLCSLPVFCADPISISELKSQLGEVWGRPAISEMWSAYEQEQYRSRTGRLPHFGRWEILNSGQDDEALLVRNFDRFSPEGVSVLKIYTRRTPPRDSAGMNADRFEVMLNGVQFRERGRADFPYRQVFLGDAISAETTSDRLRLAINDNEILNPWHRRRIPTLLNEWGEDSTPVATKPQMEMVEFLMGHFRSGLLKHGALMQMPTGMGKTEVNQFFLRKLQDEGIPFRLLWMVHGNDLVQQTADRFGSFFSERNESALPWNSKTVTGRKERTKIAHGAYDHLFLSMDSMAEDSPQRSILSRWISQPGKPPVILVMDEGHQIGAKTYLALYDWLWQNFSDRIQARIGVTATPLHPAEGEIIKYFGNRSKWSFIEDEEIDPTNNLPRVSFLEQMVRAAKKGYVPIPLIYALGREPLTAHATESRYTEEELNSLSEVIAKFRPLKALFYHAPGLTEEFGSTSRMRQFQGAMTELQKGMPHLSISSSDPSEAREETFSRFRATDEGILNLTGVGSTGLDLPGTNTVALLPETSPLVLTTQRFGRGSRLMPGGAFSRWIDWTGNGVEEMLTDVASYISQSDSDSRRAQLRKLLQTPGIDPGEIAASVYEVLGVDPSLIHANPSLLNRLFDKVARASQIRRWEIKPAAEQSSVHKLPLNQTGEGLQTYFRRPDVVRIVNLRLGKSADGEASDLRAFEVTEQVASDFVGVTPKQIQTALDTMLHDERKEAGKSKPLALNFEIAPAEEQKSAHKLPPRSGDEPLSKYLFRPDVIEILNLRAGNPKSSTYEDLTPTTVQKIAAEDFRGITALQVLNNWDAQKGRARGKEGKRGTWGLDFTVRPVEEQKSIHKLPQPNSEQRLRTYFRDPAVTRILKLRLGLPEDAPDLAISRADFVRAVDSDLPTTTPNSIRKVWDTILHLERSATGSRRKRGTQFEVAPPENQISPHKLPPKETSASLQAYLSRADVLRILNLRAGLPKDSPLRTIKTAPAIKLVQTDLIGVTDLQIRAAWQNIVKRDRIKAGEPAAKLVVEFSVRAAEEQLAEHKLPPRFPKEALRAYLTRPEVLRIVLRRLGMKEDGSIFDVSPTALVQALGDDLVGVLPGPVKDAWAQMRNDERKQKGEMIGKGGGPKARSVIPRLKVKEGFAEVAAAWPRSPRLRAELPRLIQLHERVAENLLERLLVDPKLEVYFIGRDADDFLAVTHRMAEKKYPYLLPRLKRFVASNRLLGVAANNPSQYAAIASERIEELLSLQGLASETIADRKVLLFDVGFDGHVTRPLMGHLLAKSGLSPLEFRRRFRTEFLLSKPEVPMNLKQYKISDGLEFRQLREEAIATQTTQNWEALEEAWKTDPEAAIHDAFRVYGSMPMDEFPLAESFARAIERGALTRAEAVALWDTRAQPLLSSPEALRDWLESFVEGKGLQVVRSETDAEENSLLRQDLGRQRGRVKYYSMSAEGTAKITYETAHEREAVVDPHAQAARQEFFCGEVIRRLSVKP